MKKSILAIVMALVLVMSFTACGSSETEESSAGGSAENLSGGWEVNEDMEAAQLDVAEGGYVDAAIENYSENVGDGMEITPVALLATQEGDGGSYWFLCKTDDAVPLKIMSFTVNADENVGSVAISDFDIGDYTEDNDPVEHTDADWCVNESVSVLPDDVQEAFDGAFAEYTGGQVTPVLYLGSQVVAGTNYSVLCTFTTTSAEPVTNIAVATIYADLDGNYELTGLCSVNLGEF